MVVAFGVAAIVALRHWLGQASSSPASTLRQSQNHVAVALAWPRMALRRLTTAGSSQTMRSPLASAGSKPTDPSGSVRTIASNAAWLIAILTVRRAVHRPGGAALSRTRVRTGLPLCEW